MVLGMPAGFVNVREAKETPVATDVPQIVTWDGGGLPWWWPLSTPWSAWQRMERRHLRPGKEGEDLPSRGGV